MRYRLFSLTTMCARIALAGTLVVAPWLFGGYPLIAQQILCGGVLVALAAWMLAVLLNPEAHAERSSTILPAMVFPALLLLIYVAVQMLPLPLAPPKFVHAVWPEGLNVWENAQRHPISLDSARTRLALSRLLIAFSAFFLGTQLFRQPFARRWLWALLALDGAALAIFGIVQKLTWNGMLFWSVPLQSAGRPFSSFANENNAAAWLNLAMAAAIGWLISLGTSRRIAEEDAPETPAAGGGPYFVDVRRVGTATLVACFTMATIAVGILASMSYGGILASVLAMMMTLYLISQRSKRVVAAILGLAVVMAAVGVTAALVDDAIRGRIVDLPDDLRERDSRVEHWQDTAVAVQDFPWFGTGLNTYLFANRPYQAHDVDGAYHNADNVWLEWTLELGLVGVLLGGLLALTAVWILVLLARKQEHFPVADAAVVGTYLVVSQFVHGWTDFGLLLLATLLTCAVVLGAVVGAGSALRVQLLLKPRSTFPVVIGRTSALLVGLMLVASVGAALWDVRMAAASANVWQGTPNLTEPDVLDLSRVDAGIARAEALLKERPDDTDLRHWVARLWVYRYRILLHRQLQEYSRGQYGADRRSAWDLTQLSNLHAAACRLAEDSTAGEVREELDDPLIEQNLRPATAHLLLGRRYSPLAPYWDEPLACLAFLFSEDPTGGTFLRAAAARNTIHESTLMRVGNLAAHADDLTFACQLWQRVLSFDPERLESVLRLARLYMPEEQIVSRVIPSNPILLVDLAVNSDDEAAAKTALRRADEILAKMTNDQMPPAPRHALHARVAELRSNVPQAINRYEKAVQIDPLQMKWRLALVSHLEREGRIEEAIQHLEFGLKFAPGDDVLMQRIGELRRMSQQDSAPRNDSDS